MVRAQQGGDLLGLGGGVRLTLLLATFLLEFLQDININFSVIPFDLRFVFTSSPRFMTADVPLYTFQSSSSVKQSIWKASWVNSRSSLSSML